MIWNHELQILYMEMVAAYFKALDQHLLKDHEK